MLYVFPQVIMAVALNRLSERRMIELAIGKLAQYSDKNERGWPLCPKIHPNFSWMKVRTDFHDLTFCRRTGHFSR